MGLSSRKKKKSKQYNENQKPPCGGFCNVPLPGLGNSKMRHHKGFLGNFSIARRTLSDGVVNGTNGTQKRCFESVPFASGAGEMLQMLHFFRCFGSVTFESFSVPFVKIQPYFSRELGKWDTSEWFLRVSHLHELKLYFFLQLESWDISL